MKIALITIHNANNYGAILQAFAMQEVLIRYGEVEVLNYKNRHISRSFDLVRLKPTFHGVLGTGKDLCRLLSRYRAISKFKEFIDDKFKLTEVLDYSDLSAGKANGYDVYVAGSDQIWNPACVTDNSRIDAGYFLDFVRDNGRKIAYASSIGGYEYSDNEEVHVKQLLSTFEAIAVREEGTKIYLENLLDKPVHHVLDPTLLLNMTDWKESVDFDEGEAEEKYILLYTVPRVPLIKKVVDFYSKKLGIKVVSIEQGLTAGAKVDNQIRDAGPKEFINLFANAEFVITDSFHGTCFSLNFGKPFVAVSPGRHANRVESLLKLVGLESRLIDDEDQLAKMDIYFEIDGALSSLERAREESLGYLSSIFNRRREAE